MWHFVTIDRNTGWHGMLFLFSKIIVFSLKIEFFVIVKTVFFFLFEFFCFLNYLFLRFSIRNRLWIHLDTFVCAHHTSTNKSKRSSSRTRRLECDRSTCWRQSSRTIATCRRLIDTHAKKTTFYINNNVIHDGVNDVVLLICWKLGWFLFSIFGFFLKFFLKNIVKCVGLILHHPICDCQLK